MCVQGSTGFVWLAAAEAVAGSLCLYEPLFWALVMVPPAHGQLQIPVALAPDIGCGYQQPRALHLPT